MTKLLPETLESLAEAVITAEIQQHFTGLDPVAVVKTHEGVLEARAELLGLGGDLTDADLAAVAAVVDNSTVTIEAVVSS